MISRRTWTIANGVVLAIFVLVLLIQSLVVSSEGGNSGEADELDELEQLLAIEDEEESKGDARDQGKPSDADVLAKAQRIVLELSNDNAKRVVEGSEYVLLLGYAPWCVRSAELMPRFAEAATALREMGSSLVMAKLDVDQYEKAASVFGIKGLPTLLLFVNGSAQPYTGGFTAKEIVIWSRKKTGTPIIRLHSKNAAEDFIKGHPTFVVGLFKKFEGTEYEEFVKAAASNNDIQFVESDDLNVAKVIFPDIKSGRSFLGIVKSEPEFFVEFGEEFVEDKILKFIELNKYPLVTRLTELNSANVYSSPISLQVFVFASVDDIKNLTGHLQVAARKYKEKIMFIYVDTAEENLAKPFMTLFGFEEDKPLVTAFDSKVGSKYLLESDPTPEKLDEFCAGLLRGILSPYFKSEPVPATVDVVVQKIVGKTFTTSVLENSENVFLEVSSPWCIDCEETSKLVEKLATHFRGTTNLAFGRIDASVNEHPNLKVDHFPTLLFYPSGNKSNPVKVSKKSSLEELIDFVDGFLRSEDGKIPSGEQTLKDEL